MNGSRVWQIFDRHPYWVAALYLGLQTLALLVLSLAMSWANPAIAGASWQDPRVLATCLIIVVGSVLTIDIVFFVYYSSWCTDAAMTFARRERLLLLPILSGACAVLVVPMAVIFNLVYGPLFAIVVLRGSGFVSARLVDELLHHQGHTTRCVNQREDAVILVVAFLVWLGIVIPSQSDPSPEGRLFTQVWLLPAYFAAYTLRLWLMNLFSTRWHQHPDAPKEQQLRIPFFIAMEQLTLTACLAVGLLLVCGLAAISQNPPGATPPPAIWKDYAIAVGDALPFMLTGIPIGLAAILAMCLLLTRDKSATHNFSLYRITASLSAFAASFCLWTALILTPGRSFPARDAVLAAGFFSALLVLHAGKYPSVDGESSEEPSWAARLKTFGRAFWANIYLAMGPAAGLMSGGTTHVGAGSPQRTTLRLIRFLFVVALLVFIAPSTHTALRILSGSPYSNTANPIAVIGEILYSNAASALPVFALVALLIFLFQTRAASRDAAALVDYGEAGLGHDGSISDTRFDRIDTAAKRITLAVGIMSGLIALGAWMQTSLTGRHEVARHLSETFAAPGVVEGRRLLRRAAADPHTHSQTSCAICASMRAYLRGEDSAHVHHGAREPRAPIAQQSGAEFDGIATSQLAATLNAVERVLEARRTGALSEIEFHSVWAGVVWEILSAFQVHLDGYPEMQARIETYLPMLSQQMATQPWPSDRFETRNDPSMREKRAANHRTEPAKP